jgi:hypothetical protein
VSLPLTNVAVCWDRCAGTAVLGPVCWDRCAGTGVLVLLCWDRCAGTAAVGQLTIAPADSGVTGDGSIVKLCRHLGGAVVVRVERRP